jgi:hypothetical protein
MKTPRRIVMTKAGPYRMRYRPDPIERLSKPARFGRIPMVGDPHGCQTWHSQTFHIYKAMIVAKDRAQRRGLWLWAV